MGPHYCFCSVQPHTLRHPVDIHRRSNLRRAIGRLSLRSRPVNPSAASIREYPILQPKSQMFSTFAGRVISHFFFSSRRRHTRSVSAFLLNRSSDLDLSHLGFLAG